MHDRLDDDRGFENQHGTNHVVVTARHAQPGSQMAAVAVTRRTFIDNLKQKRGRKRALGHALSGVARNDDGAIKPLAVHRAIM